MVTPHALVTDPIGGPVVQAGEKPAGGGARWVGPAGVAVVKRTGTAGSHVCAWVPQDGGDGTDAEVRRRAACAASRLRGLNPPLRSPAPRARAPRGPRVPAYPRPPAAGPPIDRGCGTSVRLLGGGYEGMAGPAHGRSSRQQVPGVCPCFALPHGIPCPAQASGTCPHSKGVCGGPTTAVRKRWRGPPAASRRCAGNCRHGPAKPAT